MSEFKTFETERLILRPTTEQDAEFVLRLMNSPKWLKYIGDRKVRTLEAAQAYIRDKVTPQLERLGFANYTVIIKEYQEKIGTCGLYAREGVDGIDIGFAFLPDFEGKGYAFESANRIKTAAFEEFGLNEFSAYTTMDNFSSQRLLEKLGLSKIGTTWLPNDKEELLHYWIEKA